MSKRIVVSEEVFQKVVAYAAYAKIEQQKAAEKLITTAVNRLNALARYTKAKTGVDSQPRSAQLAAAKAKKEAIAKKKARTKAKKDSAKGKSSLQVVEDVTVEAVKVDVTQVTVQEEVEPDSSQLSLLEPITEVG